MEGPSRQSGPQQLPPELLARVLSFLRDAESVIRCMAVNRQWLQAARQVDYLFFDRFHYEKRLSGSDAEAMITKLVMGTARLRSLSVIHDDREKWLPQSTVIAWVLHTRPTLRELFISNSRDGAGERHTHHPTLFRALLEQLRNSQLEKLALDYVIIPDGTPPGALPNLRSLRFYNVRMTSSALTSLIAGCTSLELLRLIDVRDYDSVDLHCPSLREFVIEESEAVASIRLDCPRLKRLLVRDVGGIASISIEDGSKLRKVEIFTEDCAPVINIRHAASIQHAHLLYKGDPWAQLVDLVGGTIDLRELAVCIKDRGSAPVDLEDLVALCPGLRTLGIGPHLWERLSRGNFRRGHTRWSQLAQLNIDPSQLCQGIPLLSALLARCPSLKSVNLGPRAPEDKWEEEVSSFTTRLLGIMQKYPKVKIEVDYDHSYTTVPF